MVALAPTDERHLGRHDGHGEHVGRGRQVRHMRDGFTDLLHVHGRLGRDAAVGLATPSVCLRAISATMRRASPATRAGLV
jgi:hypothetical protein